MPSSRPWPLARLWIVLAGLAGASAVGMAASAAHGVADRLTPEALATLRSGVQMHGWHALALFGVGIWAPVGGRLAHAAGFAFTVGLVLFCGAVYSLALGGPNFTVFAPFGGTLLILGWLLVGASALRRA